MRYILKNPSLNNIIVELCKFIVAPQVSTQTTGAWYVNSSPNMSTIILIHQYIPWNVVNLGKFESRLIKVQLSIRAIPREGAIFLTFSRDQLISIRWAYPKRGIEFLTSSRDQLRSIRWAQASTRTLQVYMKAK